MSFRCQCNGGEWKFCGARSFENEKNQYLFLVTVFIGTIRQQTVVAVKSNATGHFHRRNFSREPVLEEGLRYFIQVKAPIPQCTKFSITTSPAFKLLLELK